ncbi:MAG: hypothetical protein QXK46_02430 [Candidatus Caldarchaeum sp.]
MAGAGYKQLIGYVSNIAAKAVKEGVAYTLTVSTASGEEYLVKVRQPPGWLFVGSSIQGNAVKTEDSFQLQDMSASRELQPARALEVDSLEVSFVKMGDERQAIITCVAANKYISAPALSNNVVKKAEKLLNSRGVVHVADLPTGKKIVAVQTLGEYRRDTALKRLLGMVGEDER